MLLRQPWHRGLQRQSIALQKKQPSPDEETVPDAAHDRLPSGTHQRDDDDAQPELVPQPLAMQGPAAVWRGASLNGGQ